MHSTSANVVSFPLDFPSNSIPIMEVSAWKLEDPLVFLGNNALVNSFSDVDCMYHVHIDLLL